MRFKLSENTTQRLILLPETGPGFQLVSASVDGVTKPFLVLNAEHAIDLSDLPDYVGTAAAALAGKWINVEQKRRINRNAASVTMDNLEIIATRVGGNIVPPQQPGQAAALVLPSSLVKTTTLRSSRRFHRFSAFNPDRRVNLRTGDFVAGTYGFPDSDVRLMPTGLAAVGRLALPNSSPASHHYVIEAAAGTTVSFGTVAPAFGQAGGGVEAFFANAVVNVAAPRIWPARIPDE